uniref:Potassium two pore domain channel subfamily K member 17 n=1 Tax=Canis lupus familiaris TaxID=9615 RepID=A0A8P0TKP4_CANLF
MVPGAGLPASPALCGPRARAAAARDPRAPECAVPGTLLLLLAYLAYLALGAGVFWVLESPAARDSSARFQRDKWALLRNFTCLDGPALDSLIRGIIQAYQSGDIVLGNTTSMGRWEFVGSFFFSVSTVTTIGYGNLSPRTMAARLFCIFFALVGIPLNLVVLNRLGHLMQQGMHRCARRLGGTWQDPAKARWLVGSSTLLSGLLFFLLLPPLLFCHMEGWSYVESFYFAFITLSTVGFGDYVIEGPCVRGLYCPFLTFSILRGSLWLWKEIFEKVSSNWVCSRSDPQSGEMCLRRAETSGSKGHICPPHSSENDFLDLSSPLCSDCHLLESRPGCRIWLVTQVGPWTTLERLPFTQSTVEWYRGFEQPVSLSPPWLLGSLKFTGAIFHLPSSSENLQCFPIVRIESKIHVRDPCVAKPCLPLYSALSSALHPSHQGLHRNSFSPGLCDMTGPGAVCQNNQSSEQETQDLPQWWS